MIRDRGDTLAIDGVVSVFEQRGGSPANQLVVTLQADPTHADTIPTALRAHVSAVRLEAAAGTVVYRATIANNTSQLTGPPVLAIAFRNGMDQPTFDTIRQHVLSSDLVLVIETDTPAVAFPKTRLVLREAHDWVKASSCKGPFY